MSAPLETGTYRFRLRLYAIVFGGLLVVLLAATLIIPAGSPAGVFVGGGWVTAFIVGLMLIVDFARNRKEVTP